MGLRKIAEADLATVLENTNDFGWDIVLIDPSEVSYNVVGSSNDIGQVIDPETGQVVSGRQATIALRISSLSAIPEGVSDATKKPWLAVFDDINGNSFTFKIIQTHPDRTLGVVTCILEIYEP